MSNVPRKKEPDATIRFTHQSAFNEIVGTSQVCLSHYFLAHWLPLISPNGLKILLQLRSMGYYNPKTEVRRGDIDIEQPELAKMVGISVKTIQRAFADDPVLAQYVQRVFQVKRDKFGRIVKEHYVYVVTMDDVLTPEDQARYRMMLHGPDKGTDKTADPDDAVDPASESSYLEKAGNAEDLPEKPPEAPNRRSVASEANPKRQGVASEGQNGPPSGQSVASGRQSVASYKESLTLLTEENTSNTPGAAPEFSLALFEEKSPEPEKAPAPPSWPSLPEAEQQPWLDQARQELEAIHAGSGITPKPKLVEVRAGNLYEVSLRAGAK